MENEILRPLGLVNTGVGMPDGGKPIAEGRRLGYRRSFEYRLPVVEGRIPAGYFYSNAADMGRWLLIWLGKADIPEEYKALVEKVKGRLEKAGDYFSGWELFEGGIIGHSGGTPNYSSRIAFSERSGAGVCVLTDINAAASTDSLCNGLLSLAEGGEYGGLRDDVWTVFDRIFTIVSTAGIALIAVILRVRRRGAILVCGISAGTVLAALCFVLPCVFGAGLGEILFRWAPYSLAGGMAILACDVLLSVVRLLRKDKYEDNKETS